MENHLGGILLFFFAGCGAPPTEPAVGPSALPAHLGAGWTARVRGQFSAPLSGRTVTIDGAGARIERAGQVVLALHTSVWGREGALVTFGAGEPDFGCAPDAPADCAGRVERSAPGVTEWWVGLGSGLEQGWVVHDRPEGTGPLVFEVAVEGGHARAGGRAGARGARRREETTFTDATGTTWDVGALAAWDADGVALPATLLATATGLRVEVDDAGARFPVTVDPVYTTASWSADGEGTQDDFGYAVAGAGDVNNDGYADVIVGAPGFGSDAGRAYVYLGSALGLSSTAATTLTGEVADDAFGASVAGAGDIDGDGFADVLVGAPGYGGGAGRVYVYPGSAAGTAPAAAFTLDGDTDDLLGVVAGAGDVDADGFSDVLLGAPGWGDGRGRAYLHMGAVAGLGSSPVLTVAGGREDEELGAALSGAGDVNGDGFGDVLIGAPGYEESFEDWEGGTFWEVVGQVHVLYGSAAGVTRDGESTMEGDDKGERLGYSVAAAGDVNADGYADLIVGAPGGDIATSPTSEAIVYHGSAGGVNINGNKLEHEAEADERLGHGLGISVAGLGDVDRDGYDDVGAGAAFHRADDGYASWAYQYAGGGSEMSLDARFQSGMNSQIGHAQVAAAGDVNGDGLDDVLIGTSVYDGGRGHADVLLGYGAEDADGDGAWTGDAADPATDCDDGDAHTFPGAGAHESTLGCMNDDDGDGYGDPAPASGVTPGTDCDDTRAAVHPGASETDCAGLDDFNCDGSVGTVDADDDGFVACTECDDRRASVNPAAAELRSDGVDSDCDGAEACDTDQDGDGFYALDPVAGPLACDDPGESVEGGQAGDCDDSDRAVNPDGIEHIADGVDQDCNGYELCNCDDDGDGFVARDAITSLDVDCDDPGESASWGHVDCDDHNADVNPAAVEVCNGVDDDCDYDTDEEASDAPSWFRDRDEDGYGDPSDAVLSCGAPYQPVYGYVDSDLVDCDDALPSVHPGAVDVPGDGIDQDCDGTYAWSPRGCATAPGAPSWLLGALALLLRRSIVRQPPPQP